MRFLLLSLVTILDCFQSDSRIVAPVTMINEGDGDGRGDVSSQRGVSGSSAAAGMVDVDNEPPKCSGEDTKGETDALSAAPTTAGTNRGAPSVASISVRGAQGTKKLTVGDHLEYRWGRRSEWFRCCLTLVHGEGAAQVVELEFLPDKKRKTKGIRSFSGVVKVADLAQYDDLALPGTHILDWD